MASVRRKVAPDRRAMAPGHQAAGLLMVVTGPATLDRSRADDRDEAGGASRPSRLIYFPRRICASVASCAVACASSACANA